MSVVRLLVAVLISASGAVSGLLFFARIRKKDYSLLYFGLGAGLYGARLFFIVAGQEGGAADLMIRQVMAIPLVLFFVEVLGPTWKTTARWTVAAYLAVAVVALAALLLHNPALALRINSVVILLSIPLFMAMVFLPWRHPDRDLQVLRAGLTIFLLFVVYTNLAYLKLLPGNPNLEFIGFAINLCCLGYVAVARTRRNEERLLGLNKELEIARNIQSQLLPQQGSTVTGLITASRYVPASSVAGDFYDFLVQDGTLGVLIADVSGHGIPAALSASMVKVAVRSQMERAGDPGKVLHGMNSILCGNLQGQFVTAAYLFLNPAQGTLACSGAGHPPLLVWRARARLVESLEENGLPLGIFPDGSYTTKTAALAPGDRCLLYTDGLLEGSGPSGEEFGSQRLRDFLTEHASLPAQDFCDALVQELDRWCGKKGNQQDDVTIVAIDFPDSSLASNLVVSMSNGFRAAPALASAQLTWLLASDPRG